MVVVVVLAYGLGLCCAVGGGDAAEDAGEGRQMVLHDWLDSAGLSAEVPCLSPLATDDPQYKTTEKATLPAVMILSIYECM